ncbi:MAG: GNAT family N-acetyltransferase [Candidatus Acidiferrales bacterium]
MPRSPASIRSAERDDANFLAWAILTASRSHLAKGWFDIVLEGPESTRLDYVRRLTLTSARSWWHYSRFWIAELDGAPAAALCAFRAGEAYPLSQSAMTEAARELGWGEAELRAIWQRGSYMFACTLEQDDAWAVENVATRPEYRRRGLTGQLLEHAVREARRNGANLVQITFFIGNDAAEHAYAKAGFKFKDEKRDANFGAIAGAPGLRRFVRQP